MTQVHEAAEAQHTGTAAAAPSAIPATQVTMKDGRTVSFGHNRKRIVSPQPNGDLRFDFRDGETRTVAKADIDKYVGQFLTLGVESKYSANDAKDFDDIAAQLAKGQWSLRGTGLGGTSVLVRALVKWSGKTPSEAVALLKGKTQKDKMALRNSQATNSKGQTLASVVAEVQSGRKARTPDTAAADALLKGFAS